MGFIKASKTVLLVSDQGLYVYLVAGSSTALVEVVPWDAHNFEKNVAAIIARECNNAPVLILNDMVEQHYRKEKVPKVGILDKSNVVDRKLLVTFPNYPIRAALPLKEKVQKTEKKVSGGVYIFAAVPSSDQFNKTLGVTKLTTSAISGFCLLPIESSDLVKKLSDKLFPKEKAKWAVFLGQHRGGGLRQIVTRNGELALTRMTPVCDISEGVDKWAQEVNVELNATMSYLTRFGFDQSEGLNVIAVSSEDGASVLSDLIDIPCNFTGITPQEAAKNLGINLNGIESSHYADSVHVVWAGRKSSYVLPMKIKEVESVSKPRQIAATMLLLLFMVLMVQVYYFATNFEVLYRNYSDIDESVQKKAELDKIYQKEVKRKADLGFDIQLVQSSIAVRDGFHKNDIDFLDLFYKIGFSLGKDMRLDKIDVKRAKVLPQSNTAMSSEAGEGEAKRVPLYDAVLSMSFPSTIDVEKGNADVRGIQSRLQNALPDDVVKITKLLENYQYSEEIVVQAGNAADQGNKTDYVAEIKIEIGVPK